LSVAFVVCGHSLHSLAPSLTQAKLLEEVDILFSAYQSDLEQRSKDLCVEVSRQTLQVGACHDDGDGDVMVMIVTCYYLLFLDNFCI
jgi:hypothetical protein